MKKLFYFIGFVLFSSLLYGQGSAGDIQGQIFENSKSETPAAYAKVWVERGATRFGAVSDETGRFRINSIPTGLYVLKINYASDTLAEKIIANVKTDGIEYLGRINFYDENINVLDGVDVIRYRDRLIDHGDVGQIRISPEDIVKSSAKNDLKTLLKSRNSDIQTNENGEMMIRGSRPNDLVYYLDGVKIGEVKSIPSSAIGGITIYTNAIPAKYGDTNGGVIIMETKSYFDMWRAWKIKNDNAIGLF